MEGNYKKGGKRYLIIGFTLVAALITMAIVGILSVAASSAVNSSWQLSQTNKVKAYLLSIQAMQSRSWLETGLYLPLSALPQADVQNVSFSQINHQGSGYEVVATFLFKDANDSCRTIKISETALSPKSCW